MMISMFGGGKDACVFYVVRRGCKLEVIGSKFEELVDLRRRKTTWNGLGVDGAR